MASREPCLDPPHCLYLSSDSSDHVVQVTCYWLSTIIINLASIVSKYDDICHLVLNWKWPLFLFWFTVYFTVFLVLLCSTWWNKSNSTNLQGLRSLSLEQNTTNKLNVLSHIICHICSMIETNQSDKYEMQFKYDWHDMLLMNLGTTILPSLKISFSKFSLPE